MSKIAIRREDLSYERRAPLGPSHIEPLSQSGIQVLVEPAEQRIFLDGDYAEAGATITTNLNAAPTIMGLKEIATELLLPDKTYLFFSHTIKGQARNMPMLKRLMELNATLIDYEPITDEAGKRIVFFGRFAGLAGMIDTFWALGKRMEYEGKEGPFKNIRQATDYQSLDQARADLRQLGKEIQEGGLPEELSPLIIGIAGDGNVARGAKQMLAELPSTEIDTDTLLNHPPTQAGVYHIVLDIEELVQPRNAVGGVDREEYYRRPEAFRSTFAERYLPHLHLVLNCAYWDERYPRLITRNDLRALYSTPSPPRLKVIGDLSCDVNGSVEATVKSTQPDNPIYVFNPETGEERDGAAGDGPVVLAVYNLPSELPREASIAFGNALLPLIPSLANYDRTAPLANCGLPPALQRATILYRGELTPQYRYLEEYL